jgi:hypothetical protein
VHQDCNFAVAAPLTAFANSILQLQQFSTAGAVAVSQGEACRVLVDAVTSLRTNELRSVNSSITATNYMRAAATDNVTVTTTLGVLALVDSTICFTLYDGFTSECTLLLPMRTVDREDTLYTLLTSLRR